jgi:hypothetical protein
MMGIEHGAAPLEVRGLRLEAEDRDRGQTTEDRRQTTDDRGQTTEVITHLTIDS